MLRPLSAGFETMCNHVLRSMFCNLPLTVLLANKVDPRSIIYLLPDMDNLNSLRYSFTQPCMVLSETKTRQL